MKAVLSATMPPNVRGTGFAISALTQGVALGAGNYMVGKYNHSTGTWSAHVGVPVGAGNHMVQCTLPTNSPAV